MHRCCSGLFQNLRVADSGLRTSIQYYKSPQNDCVLDAGSKQSRVHGGLLNPWFRALGGCLMWWLQLLDQLDVNNGVLFPLIILESCGYRCFWHRLNREALPPRFADFPCWPCCWCLVTSVHGRPFWESGRCFVRHCDLCWVVGCALV